MFRLKGDLTNTQTSTLTFIVNGSQTLQIGGRQLGTALINRGHDGGLVRTVIKSQGVTEFVDGYGLFEGLRVGGVELGRSRVGGQDSLPADALGNLWATVSQLNCILFAGLFVVVDAKRDPIGRGRSGALGQLDNPGLIVELNRLGEDCPGLDRGTSRVVVVVLLLEEYPLDGTFHRGVVCSGLGGRVFRIAEDIAAGLVVVGLTRLLVGKETRDGRLVVSKLRGEGLPIAEDKEPHC